MKSSLTFSGGRELERALEQLGSRIAGRLGVNATKVGARVIRREARRRVPVVTGTLRNSIVVRGDDETRRLGGRERQAFVIARAPHAHLVELGTVHSAAKPFLRPALDVSGQKAIDRMGQNLGRGIEREARKLAQRRG